MLLAARPRTDFVERLLAARPLLRPTSQVTPPYKVDELSAREVIVLQYLATSMSYQEIAEALYLSINTVKTHVKHVLRKLSASSPGRGSSSGQGAALSLMRRPALLYGMRWTSISSSPSPSICRRIPYRAAWSSNEPLSTVSTRSSLTARSRRSNSDASDLLSRPRTRISYLGNHGTSLVLKSPEHPLPQPIGERHPLWVTVMPPTFPQSARREPRSVAVPPKRVRSHPSPQFTPHRVMFSHPGSGSYDAIPLRTLGAKQR